MQLKLRTLLLIVNVIVIMVPLSGIYFFRLYENELVRQTEAELISQGALIAAMYKKEVPVGYGIPVIVAKVDSAEPYSPIPPTLSMASSSILPPRPDGQPTEIKADSTAQAIGTLLSPILAEAKRTTLTGVRLLDYQGIVIDNSQEAGMSLAHVEEVQIALTGKFHSVLRERISTHPAPLLSSVSRASVMRVFVAMPVINNDRLTGVVMLSRSPRNVMKALYEERQGVIAVAIVLLLAVVLISTLTSYAINRPIRRLLGKISHIEDGSDPGEIPSPATMEIAQLSDKITVMAEKIRARSDYIRNFAMHVSHEFKTPLTAIMGAIELLKEHQDDMSKEEKEKFFANITEDTERLRKLVSGLLELARADVLQPTGESCDVITVIHHLAKRYPSMVINTELSSLEKKLPEEVLETVMINLTQNSMQHGASRITVAITNMEIMITDNGTGISTANAAKLFTPFFTTNRQHGGTGLGLVIVQSLLHHYHAIIQLTEHRPHAVFTIKFSQ